MNICLILAVGPLHPDQPGDYKNSIKHVHHVDLPDPAPTWRQRVRKALWGKRDKVEAGEAQTAQLRAEVDHFLFVKGPVLAEVERDGLWYIVAAAGTTKDGHSYAMEVKSPNAPSQKALYV